MRLGARQGKAVSRTERKFRKKRLRLQSLRKALKKPKAISSILSAAAALPILAQPVAIVRAQEMPKSTTIRTQYSYFQDWQSGRDERMTVHAPMLMITSPVAESTEIEASILLDTMSGASPVFADTLSGASGKGIDDERWAGDLTITQHFDRFSLSLGGTFSSEQDYDSEGGSLSSKFWSEDKNTVFLLGVNGNHDTVGSENDPELDQLKRSWGGIFGVTQVLDKLSMVQSNFSYQTEDGFLTDPYKLGDNRPQSRDRFAWLTRYVRYIESASASLHLDYRFYYDSWDIMAHTFEAAWYQPLDEDENWVLRPRLRYYSQDDASFYSGLSPNEIEADRFYTSDQRLSAFGSLTAGLKLIRQFGDGFSANFGYDFTVEDNALTIFNKGSPGQDNVYLSYFNLGITKKF